MTLFRVLLVAAGLIMSVVFAVRAVFTADPLLVLYVIGSVYFGFRAYQVWRQIKNKGGVKNGDK